MYDVRKILSPSSSVLLLAKTITHPAARSLCDSWASCYFCFYHLSVVRFSWLLCQPFNAR